MAYNADGAVYIDTELSTKGFEAGSKEVEDAARRMAKRVSGIGNAAKIALQKQTDAFIKQNQAYAQQEKKVSDLENELEKLSNTKVETDEFREIGLQIDNDTKKLNQLKKAQEDFLAVGGKTNSSAYRKRQLQIEELTNSIRYAKGEQEELLSSGGAYKTPDTSKIESKLASERQKLSQMNTSLGTSYAALKAKTDSYSKSARKLSDIKKKAINLFGKFAKGIKRAGTAMLGLNKNTKKTQMTLGRMLAMSLLFSTVFRALSAVTNGIKEGIVNLAQYSDRTNASLSSLMSALTQLKNSFATAFAPVLNVVAPILTTFINLISRAVTYVGMFIAALTGQKTFTKAIGVQQDFAASLGNTADAAGSAADAVKDAEKANDDYLSGLDEVNRWQSKDSGSGSGGSGGGGVGGGLSPDDMFETVPIESSIANMVDKIKKLIQSEDWEGLGAYIASGINRGMQKIYDVINWNNVGPKVTYFVTAFTETFNSLVNHINWELIGRTIGAGINTLVNTLNLLIEGIDWISLGMAFAIGLMGMVNEVNWINLGNLIGNKFMIAWKMLYGFVTNLDYSELGLALADLINGAIDKIDVGMIFAALSTLAVGILQMLCTAIENTEWSEVGQKIADGLRSIDWIGIGMGLFDLGYQLISALLEAFGQLPMPVQMATAAILGLLSAFAAASAIQGVIAAIQGVITVVGTVTGVLGGPLTAAIVAVIAIIILLIANWDKVKETMQKFDEWLQGVFSHDWREEFGILGEYMNAFLANVRNIWNSVKQIFNGVMTFFSGVFSGNWRQAWEGVKQIFAGAWNFMSSVVRQPINAIIAMINNLLYGVQMMQNSIASALNNLNIDFPDWLQDLTGHSGIGFNVGYWRAPRIPYLASGAVIPPNRAFMAVLGDQRNGNNIEAPEGLIRKIVREESGNNRQGDVTYRFTGTINRRVVFEEIIEEAKLRQTISGNNPFELA